MHSTKKLILIIAGGVSLSGLLIALLALGLVGFNLSSLSTQKPLNEKSYSFNQSEVSSISIEDVSTNIMITGTDTNQIKIDSLENDSDFYSIQTSTDGQLQIQHRFKLNWYEQIGFNFPTPKRELKLTVPKTLSGALSISNVSGDIQVIDVANLTTVNLSSASGNISCNNVSASQPITVSNISGAISLDHTNTTKNIKLAETSGSIAAQSVKIGGDLNVTSVSGSTNFVDTQIAGTGTLESTSGNITLNPFSCSGLDISTVSGNVLGRLSGDINQYTIQTSSISGKIYAPPSGSGSSQLNVTTTSGDIDLKFLTTN